MTAQDGTAPCDTAARGMLARGQSRSALREAVDADARGRSDPDWD
ncbi:MULTISPECIES: hypothetical protein [unclassified Amycolatopsis]|nr:hypothetical protein [Amycolatopsis sp. DSM 110486]